MSLEHAPRKFLRRKHAAEYLKERYGFGATRTLAKLATIGGGPVFRKAGTIVLYEPADLDAWALSRLSAPLRSTSDEIRSA
jgi:hypothetical protein